MNIKPGSKIYRKLNKKCTTSWTRYEIRHSNCVLTIQAKRAKGDDPLVGSVRLADKMYKEMKDLDNEARKRYFEEHEADFESVKSMYVNSVGIKK